MRVLVLGADGLIGSAVVGALRARGVDVVRGLRSCGAGQDAAPPADVLAFDFLRDAEATVWESRLQGIDAVVNAVGVFAASDDRLDQVHARAPIALFEGCVRAGVRSVVQVSALGSAPRAETAFLRSKNRADDALLALPLRGVVLQPSLVFGTEGASTRLFLQLARWPVWLLPQRGDAVVQPVHVDDLAEAVVNALLDDAVRGRIAAVGPRALPLRDYLQCLRRSLGLGPARVAPAPAALLRLAAALPGLAAFASRDAQRMLAAGSQAPVGPFRSLLMRMPRDCREFLVPREVAFLRERLRLAGAFTGLRLALAVLWLASGVVSLGLYPKAQSLAMLDRAAVPEALAPLALYGAAGLDLLFGLVLLFAPRGRRWYRWQIALVAFYSAVIAAALPELLLHPFAPVIKNIPVAAALWLLHCEERGGEERGRWTT